MPAPRADPLRLLCGVRAGAGERKPGTAAALLGMARPNTHNPYTYLPTAALAVFALGATALFVLETMLDRIGFYTLLTTFAALVMLGSGRERMALDAYRMACLWFFWLAYGAFIGLSHLHLNVALGYIFSVGQVATVAGAFTQRVRNSRVARGALACAFFMLLFAPNPDALVHEAPLVLSLVRICMLATLWVASALADTASYDLAEHPYRRLVRTAWVLFVSRWALLAAPVVLVAALVDARHCFGADNREHGGRLLGMESDPEADDDDDNRDPEDTERGRRADPELGRAPVAQAPPPAAPVPAAAPMPAPVPYAHAPPVPQPANPYAGVDPAVYARMMSSMAGMRGMQGDVDDGNSTTDSDSDSGLYGAHTASVSSPFVFPHPSSGL